ncbi:zinc finger protein 423 homolog [Euwallacea similis]|uniref:zinc finger protein 423 homolog n=1 Tax=Euwallacea similis TaxID=1736056 RepID=UPI00344B4350
MKMLFKGHSTRLEMLIEKIHSTKENSCQDSEVSGSSSSEVRPTSTENLAEIPSDSPKSQSYSDTEEERDWDEPSKTAPENDGFPKSSASIEKGENRLLQFSCGYCPRQFKHKRSRDRHTKLHTGDKKYKCFQCESAFARSDHLKIHMKTHDMKKQFKCNKCHKGYNTASAFSFHEKSHKQDLTKTAVVGIEDREGQETLKQNTSSLWQNAHDAESEDIKTICVYCFQWFSSIELLREHIQTCHVNVDDKKKNPDLVKNSPHESDSDKPEKEESSFTLKRPKEEFLIEDSPPLKRLQYEDPLKTQEAFICSCCYEALPNFKSFLVHMETHVSSIRSRIFQHCEPDSSDTSNTPAMVFLPNYVCCCHCNMVFENSDKLQEHLIECHVVTLYKCSLCDKFFDDVPTMKAHLDSQHMKSFEHFECHCLEEPKLFHDRVSAELHLSKYHSSNKNSEDWTDYKGQLNLDSIGLRIRDEYLDKNPASVGTPNHRCVYCKEFCKTKTDLQLHLRSHQLSDKSRHKCNICDETFGSPSELASHKLIHCKIVEGNVCIPCKTIIMDEDSFVKHQLKHNDSSKSSAKLNIILPYICIVCGQTLQSDMEIEMHAKFHLKFLSERSNKNNCVPDSSFPSEEPAYSNKDKPVHFGGVLDPNLELQCHLCKKPFSSKDKLQVHLIEHNFFGINQFNCYVCSSVFTGAAGLQNHLIGHNLAEKPYQCSRCCEGFFFRAELDNHKYLHSFKVQFDCLSDESIVQARHFSSV